MRFIALSPEVAGGGGHAGGKSSEVAGGKDEVQDCADDVAHRNAGVADASAAVASWCGQCCVAAINDEAAAVGQHWLRGLSIARTLGGCLWESGPPLPLRLFARRTVTHYRSHSCPQRPQRPQRKQEHPGLRGLSMAMVILTCLRSSLRP